MMRKKVLLMGKSGSGKTSMRSVIFSNNPASLTSRLGATNDVEQNHVRFLGDLILNLWDCGGQESFMDSYLTAQEATIFQHVAVLIYVFEIDPSLGPTVTQLSAEKERERERDVAYYRGCLAALARCSPGAQVFVLVHKMDLVRADRTAVFERRVHELKADSQGTPVTAFGTSIWDESLYKAWSRIVHALIPNASVLARHLTTFADACDATEAVLFERTTFLVIATSADGSAPASELLATDAGARPHEMDAGRYERTSELVKSFKQSCARAGSAFRALELVTAGFTAVLDELTRNTYILVVTHNPDIETAAIKLNIQWAREKFERLQSESVANSS